jgi:hypothetical protein
LPYNLFMRKFWLLLLAAIPVVAQTSVDMGSEPHHHLLMQNDSVRVFSLSLRPGEQAYVRHDHNFLVVTPQDCEVVIWSEGQSPVQNFHFAQGDTRFLLAGGAAGIRNDRPTDYHNVTVEFLNPKVTSYGYRADTGTWGYGSGGINPPVDPHAKFANRLLLGAATVVDVQLLPGDAWPTPEAGTGELLIPVTDVDLKDGDRHIRKASGEVTLMETEQKFDLRNASGGPIRFTVVELKTEAK